MWNPSTNRVVRTQDVICLQHMQSQLENVVKVLELEDAIGEIVEAGLPIEDVTSNMNVRALQPGGRAHNSGILLSPPKGWWIAPMFKLRYLGKIAELVIAEIAAMCKRCGWC